MTEATANRGFAPRLRLPLSIIALGVVFGDIGTSPLYALRVTVNAAGGSAAPGNVLGALSLIFWAITLVVSGKYVAAILRTDNHGEGGIMALAALLDLHRSGRGTVRAALLFVAVLGAALLFGDGVITPAISVLSAVEGVAVWRPELAPWTVPIAALVLVVLFVGQRSGTSSLGSLFGPVILLWFAVLALSGASTIFAQPAVLEALDPRLAIEIAGRSPATFLAVIGAAFLAVTGGEALYADLGQFGRRPIARAWYFIAMPSLLLNYFGQGALLLASPQAIENPFYLLFPPQLTIFAVIVATLATIIASQAVLTGVFSLSRQATELGLLPPMRTFHTSHENEHHVYIPAVNALMGAACLVVAVAFGSSDNLASAYGVAVAGAMVTTTILYITVKARRARGKAIRLTAALGLGVALLGLDGVFLAGNAIKFLDGAFVPLLLAGFGVTVAYSWHIGRRRMSAIQAQAAIPLQQLIGELEANRSTSARPGIFLIRPGQATPQALAELANLVASRFATIAIVTVWTATRPRVPKEDRIRVTRFSEHVSRIDLRVGYLQRINLPSLLGPTLAQLGIEADEASYVVGLERPVAPESWRRPLDPLLSLFAVLAKLAMRSPDRFHLPKTRTLEVGMPRQL